MPKGDTTGPLTGQMSPPEPGLIGPLATGPLPFGADASWAWIFALSFSSSARSPSRCWRLLRVLASAALVLAACSSGEEFHREARWPTPQRGRETFGRGEVSFFGCELRVAPGISA
jgi:hypothetical protein